MHKIDIELVEMSMDVMKYVIDRISATKNKIGKPKSAKELKNLVGETVTEKGIGGLPFIENRNVHGWESIIVKMAVSDHQQLGAP